MNELHRQAYLDAMGVDSYFPRALLPGALPSPHCLIEIKAPELEAQTERSQASADGQGTSSAVKDVMASMGFNQTVEKKTSAAKTVAQESNEPQAVIQPPAANSIVPEFSLQLVVGQRYSLLAKAMPESNSSAYHQMLSNILFALGEQSQVKIHPFSWPMINSSAVDQSLPIATQALDAYVKDNVEQRTLIILGDAGDYLDISEKQPAQFYPSETSYSYIVSSCAAEAFLNPSLKRRIWDDLLAVRQAG